MEEKLRVKIVED